MMLHSCSASFSQLLQPHVLHYLLTVLADSGICFEKGRGVAKDESEALRWYNAAAAQGHAVALYHIGTSLRLFDEAALSMSGCLCVEGLHHYNGRGNNRDIRKAIECFEGAAAQNAPNAAFMLGVCYQKMNPTLSEQYFERAKSVAWSAGPQDAIPGVASLSATEHFSKWHYLNLHQLITDGFRDAGRPSSPREVIEINEKDMDLRRCVIQAQKLLGNVAGTVQVLLLSCDPQSTISCCACGQ
jgi:hypothetical protein